MIKQTDRKQESMPGSSKNKELLLTLGGGEMEKKKKSLDHWVTRTTEEEKPQKKLCQQTVSQCQIKFQVSGILKASTFHWTK